MSERFLEGRTAMVTGGASGMGRAMALAFAGAGAEVAIGSLLAERSDSKAAGELAYLPGAAELEATAEEIRSRGVAALASGLDVTSAESVAAFHAATLERFGTVDILANAAGVSAEQTVSGHDDGLWNKVIDVNLTGTYRTIKLCLPGMIERSWGRIINIASTAASVGAATSAAYCASKAGVVGLSRCVALEGAAHGVSCNAISPTWVETSFGKDWMGDIAERQEGRSGADYIAEVKAANPQGRLVQPKEIGALALFLCRDDAFGITMQELTVSAGSLW
ncbi:MAG: SDR family NAD(P)-dependent oxidoreductase [Alphaproteobacteria bacterium]